MDDEITTLVTALGGKPLNVVTVQPTMTVQHLASLGVRRISVGGALARMARAGFMQAAQEIAGQGTSTAFVDGAKGGELKKSRLAANKLESAGRPSMLPKTRK